LIELIDKRVFLLYLLLSCNFQQEGFMSLDIDTSSLSTRSRAHPFDFAVKLPSKTRGVDASPHAIGGFFGIGWDEHFRDHKTGEVYAVPCSDGVNGGNCAHNDRDLAWMEQMRERIIARTKSVRRGVITISQREWAIMLGYIFHGWLDPMPDDEHRTNGDANKHLLEGKIGTIGGLDVIVDPTATDDLPPVGDFSGDDWGTTKPIVRQKTHEPSQFGGIFAAALTKALGGVQAA
jgi:hypothetical protein